MRHLICYDFNNGGQCQRGAMIAIPDDVYTPSGFLECNGAEVSRDTYSGLYGVIGDSYRFEADSNPLLFRLPNYTGVFHDMEPIASMNIEFDGDMDCWMYRIGMGGGVDL